MPAELEFRLSAASRRDIGQIGDYGAEQFGHDVADAYLRGMASAFALLREYPLTGEQRDELGSGVRCRILRRHHIYYRVTMREIHVLRILHHSRDPARHFPQ